MSIFEIQKLQGLAPISPLGSRDGQEAGKATTQNGATSTSSVAADGVSVEVRKLTDAGEPPISNERVAEIRAALRDGSYPIVPTEIADAMIAARLSMGLES